MSVSPLLRPLGITAAILGLGQALAWSVLTILGILVYTETWTPVEYTTTFSQRLAFAIRVMYVTEVADWQIEADPRIVNNRVFFGLTCLYFALSFIWMVVSLCLLWVTLRTKEQFFKSVVLSWTFLTCIISIADIILTGLLIHDYDHVNGSMNFTYEVVAVGVIMTIAAKGFGFLLINVILVFALTKLALRINKQEVSKPNRPQPLINAYQTGENPWISGGDPRMTGPVTNPAYDNSYDPQSPPDRNNAPYNFNQSQLQPMSFTYLQNPPQNNNNNNNINSRNSNILLPKLSKTPTGPYIPAPDYTPPTSPLHKFPKSVLKSRSQY